MKAVYNDEVHLTEGLKDVIPDKRDYPKIAASFFLFFFLGPPLLAPLANDRQLSTRCSRVSVSYY